jgi:hypothetical protein
VSPEGIRDLPSRVLYYPATLTTSAVTVTTSTALVFQIILSNTDIVDQHLVTITNNKSTGAETMFNNYIQPGDPTCYEFPLGWQYDGGIKIQCDEASVVRCEIFGRQHFSL